MKRIVRDEEARQRLETWYGRFLKRIDAPCEHQLVPTSHGPSHVLLTGNPARPPLVVLHGSLTSSAHVCSELGPLLERSRIIAPDIPGQSVRGLPLRLPFDRRSYGLWLMEVLEHFALPHVDLYGISWGGFVTLEMATLAPERIRRLALMVPAGLVSGSIWSAIVKGAIPMALYRMFPSEQRLRSFLGPLLTTWDDDWAHYMGDAMRDFMLDVQPPPLLRDGALRAFTAPTSVVAASEDVPFPGAKLLARAKELIPHADVELIPNSQHAPPMTPEFRARMAERVTRLLAGEPVAA